MQLVIVLGRLKVGSNQTSIHCTRLSDSIACVAAGPRTRLNHLYSPLYRMFRASATQAKIVGTSPSPWQRLPLGIHKNSSNKKKQKRKKEKESAHWRAFHFPSPEASAEEREGTSRYKKHHLLARFCFIVHDLCTLL